MEDYIHFIKYNSKIFRNLQSSIDNSISKYGLTCGTYPYLLNLAGNEGISQSKLAFEVGHDKAMTARSITKLIEIGLIYKKEDSSDSRAYQLFLTDKAKSIIPDIKKEFYNLSRLITKDINQNEIQVTLSSLEKILENTITIKTTEDTF
mgnify:CR=1 FL=1